MQKRGQVSIEHLLILGMVILIIIPMVIIVYSSSKRGSDEATEMMLENLCNDIVDKAESLQRLGPNSWSSIDVKIPKNVINISVQGSEVIILYKAEGGVSNVVCFADVNLEEANLGVPLNNIQPGGRIKIKLEPKGPFVCVTSENNTCKIVQCNDGIDNDGDLCADEQDLGCSPSNPLDDNESDGLPGCVEAICGNYVVENPEVCDGSYSGPEDCESYLGDPLAFGHLDCGPACDLNLDTRNCQTCGDLYLNLTYEECEAPNNFGGRSCSDYNCVDGPCDRGTLSCDDCTIDRSMCTNCGNNIKEGTEQCDTTTTPPIGCPSGFACCDRCICTNNCPAASPIFSKESSPIFSKEPIPD